MNAVYTGHVAHHRPGKHRLRYSVFMLALNIDELPALGRRLQCFSYNRANLISIFDRDHAGELAVPLRSQIEAKLREAKIDWDGGAPSRKVATSSFSSRPSWKCRCATNST